MGRKRWSPRTGPIADLFDGVRAEFELADPYPTHAVAEASAAVDRYADRRLDRTDIRFVTIDPPGSMDLDQAIHLERTTDGFRVHYAIADVGAIVEPGSALDLQTRERGQTFYFPDGSVPLHPRELSEGSASLLPDQTRPAALWTIETDTQAVPISAKVERALVRSVARLDYQCVQRDADSGRLHPSIAELPNFGELRLMQARKRGAIELRIPDQEVVPHGAGWQLSLAPRTSADDWNAEISLLTGMCAADIMLAAGVGILRTLPPASADTIAKLRQVAVSLGLFWDAAEPAGVALARLDPNEPRAMAVMNQATTLLRGADYTDFSGEPPAQQLHSGIGAAYAHVTAPLRRLVDRYATEVCLAHCAGTEVPQWVTSALPELPRIMKASDSKANKVERACVDLVEAIVLADHVGKEFAATVVRPAVTRRDAEIFIADPPVIAQCAGAPDEGTTINAKLVEADVVRRTVSFSAS